MNNETKTRTFYFYALHSSISNDKIISYLGAQPPCMWVSIIIKKVTINIDRTSKLTVFISVTCDTG